MRYTQRTAYELISIRKLAFRISETGGDVSIVESLPKTLAYSISTPSAESAPAKAQAKSEVLAGKIDTNKAYKERIAELEQRAKQAEATAEQAVRSESIGNLVCYYNGKLDKQLNCKHFEDLDEIISKIV